MTETMEPSLATLIESITAQAKAPQPNAEMVELGESLEAVPLAAFSKALGSHLWSVDFGPFEATAENIEENGFYDDIVDELEAKGLAGAEGLLIGNTGGGDEALLMIGSDGHEGGYVLFRFAYDGSPYPSGDVMEEIGHFSDLVRLLQQDGAKLDEDLARLAR